MKSTNDHKDSPRIRDILMVKRAVIVPEDLFLLPVRVKPRGQWRHGKQYESLFHSEKVRELACPLKAEEISSQPVRDGEFPLSPEDPVLSSIKAVSSKNRYIFDECLWVDCGNYWLSNSPQGRGQSFDHQKYRLISCNFCAAISRSSFLSREKLLSDIMDLSSKEPAPVQQEPRARDWYSRTRNVTVAEVGLVVPKWEIRIGAFVDGVVGEGIIEIKSPLEMYEPLRNHLSKINTGWEVGPLYHNHIYESHYAQMQGAMAIMEKKWCDYIVYATQSNLCYVERVDFNQQYWDSVLWPGIQEFLDTLLEPSLSRLIIESG